MKHDTKACGADVAPPTTTRRRSNSNVVTNDDHEEITMKSLLRNAARLVFGCVCLLLSGLPTQATNIQLYTNGPALPSDT